MERPGFWYCLPHTAKLVAYNAFCRFTKTEGSFNGHKFIFEVADTIPKRRLGLSFRKGLDDGCGMLFIYPKFRPHVVWMMNMRFGIDILWLDERKKIVYMAQNAPRSYSWSDFALYDPKPKSKYVIELQEGTIKKHKIKIGSKIKFQIDGNPN